jgi:hypothetical protein
MTTVFHWDEKQKLGGAKLLHAADEDVGNVEVEAGVSPKARGLRYRQPEPAFAARAGGRIPPAKT